MTRFIFGAVSAFALAAAFSAQAGPNLLSNGSFESYTNTPVSGPHSPTNAASFTGWTFAGTGTGCDCVQAAITDGATPGYWGDVVPADPFTFSPDAAGTTAAFLWDDSASETLTQSLTDLTPGHSYDVGFDVWKTSSGAGNPIPFTLTGSLGGTTFATVDSGSIGAGQWIHYGGVVTASSADETFSFDFTLPPGVGQDVMIDMAYVTAVPEPATWAFLIFGLGGVGAVARRRRSLATA